MAIRFDHARLALPLLMLACSDGPGPTPPDEPPVTTAAPRARDLFMRVDYEAQVGAFTLAADDPDTPVDIRCHGAFPGSGRETVTLSRPFRELRHYPFLNTWCELYAAGDSVVVVFADTIPPVPLDSTPTLTLPASNMAPRVNTPVLFSMSAEDDWGIASHGIAYARGASIEECSGNWTVARRTELSPPSTHVTDTITLTFDTPGDYCIGFSARDDYRSSLESGGHLSGATNYFVVAP